MTFAADFCVFSDSRAAHFYRSTPHALPVACRDDSPPDMHAEVNEEHKIGS